MGLTFTQFALDNFNRANESPLDPSAWTVDTFALAGLQIVSQLCLAIDQTGAGDSGEDYTGVVWEPDQWAEATIPLLDPDSGVHIQLRGSLSNVLQGYECVFVNNGDGTMQCAAGSYSLLVPAPIIEVTVPFVFPVTFRFACVGSGFYLLQNGTIIGAGTDETYGGNGLPGLFIDGTPEVDGGGVISHFAGGGAYIMAPSFYRYDGSVRNPTGLAIPGADIAVLQQPAIFSTQPGSPLQELFAASTSNSATVINAVWAGGQIDFTLSGSPPSDVVPGSFIAISGVSPAPFNSVLGAPRLVILVSGNDVTVAAPNNPGAYSSGGTVATSALPNPTFSDGNGNFFFYATAGIYSLQIYGSTITERDLEDQSVGAAGAGTVTSVGITGDGVLFNSSVSGSPITTSGSFNLATSLLTQTANEVLAGPGSGGAATPTFRPLVTLDLPSTVGTVKSVAATFAVPTGFSGAVSGSPITASGTIGITLGLSNENENTVWAGPISGSPAAPTFRALTAADLPSSFSNPAAAGFQEDFISAALVASPASIIGDAGAWEYDAFGAGSPGFPGIISTTYNNPGQMTMNAGSATGGGIGMSRVLLSTAASANLGALGSNAGWEVDIWAILANTTGISIRLGVISGVTVAGDPPANGIWVRYDTDASDTQFTYECRKAGTSTATVSGVAADTNFHHLKFRSVVAGTILFSIDNGVETSIATNVPTVALGCFMQIITRDGGNEEVTIDKYYYSASPAR